MIKNIFSFLTPKRCLMAACLFFALMVAIGSIPGEAIALSARVDDRLLHFLAYSLLSSLIYVGLAGSIFSRAIQTFLLVALLGALDETIQSFMSYRNADFTDWTFDMLAATSSISAWVLLNIIKSKQKIAEDKTSIRRAMEKAE